MSSASSTSRSGRDAESGPASHERWGSRLAFVLAAAGRGRIFQTRPLTGLLATLFAGWAMSGASTMQELDMGDGPAYRIWRFVIRYVTPLAVAAVFVHNLL